MINTVAPPQQTDAFKRNDYQVVIRPNLPDHHVRPEETEKTRTSTVNEMLRAIQSPEGGAAGQEQKFIKPGLIEPGWFLVKAQDELSKNWLLESWPHISNEGIGDIMAGESVLLAKKPRGELSEDGTVFCTAKPFRRDRAVEADPHLREPRSLVT